MIASLYTHKMVYCDPPCRTPRCRGHREPLPPTAPTGRFTMPAVKPPTPPMGQDRRRSAYLWQAPFRTVMTPRQLRRLRLKLGRATRRG